MLADVRREGLGPVAEIKVDDRRCVDRHVISDRCARRTRIALHHELCPRRHVEAQAVQGQDESNIVGDSGQPLIPWVAMSVDCPPNVNVAVGNAMSPCVSTGACRVTTSAPSVSTASTVDDSSLGRKACQANVPAATNTTTATTPAVMRCLRLGGHPRARGRWDDPRRARGSAPWARPRRPGGGVRAPSASSRVDHLVVAEQVAQPAPTTHQVDSDGRRRDAHPGRDLRDREIEHVEQDHRRTFTERERAEGVEESGDLRRRDYVDGLGIVGARALLTPELVVRGVERYAVEPRDRVTELRRGLGCRAGNASATASSARSPRPPL